MPDTHGAESHVDIGKAYRAKAGPCPLLMPAVEATYAIVELVAHGMLRDLIDGSADQMPEGVAAEDITCE